MTLLIVYLTIAIGVSFLCSILEAVLLSTTPSYVATLKAERPAAGAVLESVRERLDQSLAAILILNTFAHTMGAFGVGSQALQVFGPEWETLIAVLLTLAILYFSEIIPKTLGALFWRALSVPTAHTIRWLIKVVYPLVWVSTLLTTLFGKESKDAVTREEILAMAALGKQGGAIVPSESAYMENLLRLRDITTEAVLTPRSVVHMLEQSTTVSAALDDEATRQFARIPVYQDSVDRVIGKVLRNDLFIAEREGLGAQPVSELAQPILRVAEKLPVQQLLDRLIKHREHLSLVEDEYGQTAGIVTLEDAIETLLGREIVDESDPVEDMQALARVQYRQRLAATRSGGDATDA
ncbi:MAG: CNNM domain-containing protein [Pseudomonadota bacterium]